MKYMVFLLVCIYPCSLSAQSTIRPNLYFQNQNLNYYNPASGLNSDTVNRSLTLYGKYKIIESNEVWNKPITTFANYIGRTKNNKDFYTAGFILDPYSFYNRHSLYLGYTKQFKVLNTRMLSIGARAVINADRIRWDEARQFGQTGTSTRFAPDLDLGTQYQGKHLRLGLGIKNVFANSVKLDGDDLLNNQREAYAHLSYAINFGSNFMIAPYTMIQIDRNSDIDLGMYFSAFRLINLSYVFRLREFRSIYALEFNVVKGLHVGFAADNSLLYNDVNIDMLIGYNFR